MNKPEFLLPLPRHPKHLLKDLRATNSQFKWDCWSEWAEIDRTSLVEMTEAPKEIIALCRLLERTNLRPRPFTKYLRHCPGFTHPALAHDAVSMSSFMTLLQKRSGVTLITADTAIMRIFTAYAFGLEYERESTSRASALGLSAYGDDVFVPFSGLVTVQSSTEEKRNTLIREFESKATRAIMAPVIFMDLWGSNHRLITRFVEQANRRHVIVTDVPRVIHKIADCVPENAHVIVTSSLSKHRLSITIKRLSFRR